MSTGTGYSIDIPSAEQLANRKRWLEALRSNEYEQGRGYLEADGRFCCMGVWCKVSNIRSEGSASDYDVPPGMRVYYFSAQDRSHTLPNTKWFAAQFGIREWLAGRLIAGLASRNDNDRLSFAQIADFLETEVFI